MSSAATTTINVEHLSKFKVFNVDASRVVFLEAYLKSLIETRPGCVLAHEAFQVGEIYNSCARFIQDVVEKEKKSDSKEGDEVNVSVEALKKYKPLVVSPVNSVFLQQFFAVQVEKRKGGVLASEMSGVSAIHDELVKYIKEYLDSVKAE